MSGVTTVKAKAYFLGDLNEGKKGSGENAGTHFDVLHTINNYTITASFTDSTLKDADNAPWLKDAVFTVETKEGLFLLVSTSPLLGVRRSHMCSHGVGGVLTMTAETPGNRGIPCHLNFLVVHLACCFHANEM